MDYKKELEEYILIWEFLNEKSFDRDQFKWTDGKPVSNPYKTDWNYLMEVVLKIQSLGYNIKISYTGTHIVKEDESWWTTGYLDKDSKRESLNRTYNACVNFIRLNNSVKDEENNKLIAEFMGFKYCTVRGAWENVTKCLPQHILEDNQKEYYDILYFDESWDWLLPVVQKILNQDIKEEVRIEIIKYLFSFDFNSLYNEVVQYIKRHK